MDAYSTEEQQIEAVKSFLRSYGAYIIGGLLIGLAIVLGYSYYLGNKQQQSAQLSAAYDQAKDNGQLAQFAEQHPGTTYGDMAALRVAKDFVEQGNLEAAEQALKEAATHSSDAGLDMIARLRLARVQLARNEADAALSTLDYQWPDTVAPQVAELKGDALASKGDVAGARAAYQKAIMGMGPQPLIRMKMNDLPATKQPAAAASTTADSAPQASSSPAAEQQDKE